MRHTIFADFSAAVPGGRLELSPRERDHLFKVFRAAPGDEVELLDGRGGRAVAVAERDRSLRLLSSERLPEPKQRLLLYCALPRRAKFDVLLKQAAELGVWRITPMLCERSVADGNSPERWEVLLREACKQSGNPFMPQLGAPQTFDEVLAQLRRAELPAFYGAIRQDSAPVELSETAAWLVGPEGGFSPAEEAKLVESGVRPLNLGPYVLRLETAAVCGLAVLRQWFRRSGMLLIALAVSGLVWVMSGCGEGKPSGHPLMIKGRNAVAEGDAQTAGRMFRRLVAKYPDSPEAHLALATLCDEALDYPEAALYHYDEYLRLAPESADAPAVRGYRRTAAARVLRQLEREKLPEPPPDRLARLERENAALLRQVAELKRFCMERQRRIDALERRRR